ncbi:MAG: hypothetical protein ACT4PP_09045 [Sporichthyaceae bacterium]
MDFTLAAGINFRRRWPPVSASRPGVTRCVDPAEVSSSEAGGDIDSAGVSVVGVSAPASAGLPGALAADAELARALLPAIAALTDSAALSQPVIVHGRLTDRVGQPMAGAQLLLGA